MDRETIEFNYSKAIRQAESVERLASSVDGMADNEIDICIQNLSTRWKGDNSAEFISKTSTVVGNTENLSSNLIGISAAIRNAAEAIREAELEALRIEEERAYLARLEEERLLREKEKISKTKNIIKKSKGIIAIFVIAFSFSGALSGCMSSRNDFYDKPIELTEKEKDLMRHVVTNEDNLEKGTLWDYEKDEVLEIRNMTAYLKKKYPSYDIEITKYTPSFKHPLFHQDYSSFKLEYGGREYAANISFTEDEEPYYSDDFYVYLLGDKYNKWLEEMLGDYNFSVRVYTWFRYGVGDKADENTTLEELLELYPSFKVHSFIYYPGEIDQTISNSIEDVIRSKGNYGQYEIFFTGNDEKVIINNVEINRERYEETFFSYTKKED
jgi:uncharacterized protein YukE